jgi:hypothetical protein
MLPKILGGYVSPVSQQSPTTGEQADVKSSETGQLQQDSAESIVGARANAFARMSETGISSRMLATQLHSLLDSVQKEKEEKPQAWVKSWSVVGPVVAVVVPEVAAINAQELGTIKPDADPDPVSKVKTESSDQKESLLPE